MGPASALVSLAGSPSSGAEFAECHQLGPGSHRPVHSVSSESVL